MPFERIVTAAVALVDADGAEALTLRALAQRLGSSTATLYRHVDSRADLVGHVVDHLFGEVDLDREALARLEWSQACSELALALFDVARRHPNAAPLLGATVLTGPHGMDFREAGLSILIAGGCPPEMALQFIVTLLRYIIGFAMQLPNRDSTSDAADAAAGERVRLTDPARYPVTHQVASSIPIALDEEFRVGLDLLIRGMKAYAVAGRDR